MIYFLKYYFKKCLILSELQEGFNNACLKGNINSSPNYTFANACKYGHIELVQYLLFIKSKFEFNNDSAFRLCSENGHLNIYFKIIF